MALSGLLVGGGGGGRWRGSKKCAFLKTGRNSTYIYETCTNDVDAGYPRGKGKNSILSFYATIAIGQFSPVILAFPR